MIWVRTTSLLVLTLCCFGQGSAPEAFQKYTEELVRNPQNSLAHFRIGELFFVQHNYQSAANEFHEAMNGTAHPTWIDAWAHIDLGEIFDLTGQRNRAIQEYRLALENGDNTEGAHTLATQLLTGAVKAADIGPPHLLVRYLTAPEPLVKVAAEYSDEAKLAELEGSVVLGATIAADGSAKDLHVLESLGLGLDEAAIAAAKQWSFTPGTTPDGPNSQMTTMQFDFLLPSKQSRWHLLRVEFGTPEQVLRPHLLHAVYPVGDGVSPPIRDAAGLIAAMGRQALVTLSFDVDKTGRPVRFHVMRATEPVWGHEAISFVSKWRFAPGKVAGEPIAVPCTLDLVWGETKFSENSLVWARRAFDLAAFP